VISLLIILALVIVPLALIAKLSFTVLARLLGVVSQSEVATRAEFARIREQLQATAEDVGVSSDEERAQARAPIEPPPPQWRSCPSCSAEVPSTASLCLQCGGRLGVG
jgi:hypothetical protein